MEVENDVMNLDAERVLEVKRINVSHMEVDHDVLNQIVKQVHKVKRINV
jgi:hypothetical protein